MVWLGSVRLCILHAHVWFIMPESLLTKQLIPIFMMITMELACISFYFASLRGITLSC